MTPRLDVQRKYVVEQTETGLQLVDKSKKPFKPTEEQLEFLHRLFWDWEYQMSADKVMKSLGGMTTDLRRWFRDPAFLELYQNERKKRFAGAMETVFTNLAAAVDGGEPIPKEMKWPYKQMLKIYEAEQKAQFKIFNQYNVQANLYGNLLAMPADTLRERVHGVQAAIEGDAGMEAAVTEGSPEGG